MADKQFEVIKSVHNTLKKGGYFYGTVFGFKEPWAKGGIITPVDFDKMKKYLIDLTFKIEWVSEEEGVGRKMNGDLKNWHIMKFLCRKL